MDLDDLNGRAVPSDARCLRGSAW